MSIISLALFLLACYVALGIVFGLWFVFTGAHRIDESLAGANFALRLLLLPASIALWPILLFKFFRK